MKNVIIIAAALFMFISCTKKDENALIGKWKLTEELIDIGDGKGEFNPSDAQHIIEFFDNGTFSSTATFCPASVGSEKTTGTYSTNGNKLMPDQCKENGRSITFEVSGQELILNLSCVEPCKQKYAKIG